MGRFLLGAGLLAGLLIAGIGLNLYLENVCTPMHSQIQQAADQGYPQGAALTRQAHRRWQRLRPVLSVFFDHGPMEQIDEAFAQLLSCREPETFSTTSVVLARRLSALADTHRPSLENIL